MAAPLADRLRPKTLDEIVGQHHLRRLLGRLAQLGRGRGQVALTGQLGRLEQRGQPLAGGLQVVGGHPERSELSGRVGRGD